MEPGTADEMVPDPAHIVFGLDAGSLELRPSFNALQQFQHPQRTHSVNAIASITTKYNDYFLCPWAEGGHLQEFWDKSPECSLRRSDVARWTAEQADGLASLMGSLHHNKDKSYARHGDLKADNIPHYHEGEKHRSPLNMSDLGLTIFPSLEASHAKETHRQATIGYRSPESESRKERHFSRLMDIWSLGFVFLDLIMWLTLEPRELAEDAKPGGLELRGLNALSTSRVQTPTATAHVKPGVLAYRWMKNCISYHPTID